MNYVDMKNRITRSHSGRLLQQEVCHRKHNFKVINNFSSFLFKNFQGEREINLK